MSDDPMYKLKNIRHASLDTNQTSSNVLVEAENIDIFSGTNNKAGIGNRVVNKEVTPPVTLTPIKAKNKSSFFQRGLNFFLKHLLIKIIVGVIVMVVGTIILNHLGLLP